jgi:hypothetical protein
MSPTVSFWRTFGDIANPFGRPAGFDAGEQIFNPFKYDMAIHTVVLVIWCLYTVFEMRHLGYVRTREAMVAAIGVSILLLALGPGAMYAGVWYWRENVISGLAK